MPLEIKSSINYKNEAGFTLLEILVSISVAIILFMSVTSVYNMSQTIYISTDTKAEITQNGRVILDRLIRELRQTEDIVTTIPETADDPENIPEEIMFRDGHDITEIKYIRYYLNNLDINRQLIAYYFDGSPNTYVYYDAVDVFGNPPNIEILEDRIIGEYIDDIEFWGDKLININLYLLKNNQSEIINTTVYGRNI